MYPVLTLRVIYNQINGKTIPQYVKISISMRIIVDKKTEPITQTHNDTHDRLLFWFDTCTSIKRKLTGLIY